MVTIIEDFDTVRISEFGIKFKNDVAATSFGCVGKIEGDTEIKKIVKKCEGIEKKSKSKPQKMNLKLSAHVKLAALRRMLGITTAGLKQGVYKYGIDSIGEEFILTAVAVDEFEDQQKLVAYPNCSTAAGFKVTIENGAEEVAELEIEIVALADANKGIYYEAYLAELAVEGKDAFINSWKTNFTSDLMAIAIP